MKAIKLGTPELERVVGILERNAERLARGDYHQIASAILGTLGVQHDAAIAYHHGDLINYRGFWYACGVFDCHVCANPRAYASHVQSVAHAESVFDAIAKLRGVDPEEPPPAHDIGGEG